MGRSRQKFLGGQAKHGGHKSGSVECFALITTKDFTSDFQNTSIVSHLSPGWTKFTFEGVPSPFAPLNPLVVSS